MRLITGFRFADFAASVAIFCAVQSVSAATISQWTFEPGTAGNPPSATGTDITGISPATGPGTASGHHASANTVWDNPSGNGTVESFSSNNWAIDDYYQFQTSTTGSSGIGLSFSQTSSGTGPRDFKIQYSTDGTTFSETGVNYVVLQNGGAPNPSWNNTTFQPAYAYNFNLSSIAALNNQANLYLRLVNTSTTSASGGTVGTGGTSRLDDVIVKDNIPEPTSAFLLVMAGFGVLTLGRRALP